MLVLDVRKSPKALRGADEAGEAAIGDRRVDLIDVELASESLRSAIERYGVDT
jgi:hypothetical protein